MPCVAAWGPNIVFITWWCNAAASLHPQTIIMAGEPSDSWHVTGSLEPPAGLHERIEVFMRAIAAESRGMLVGLTSGATLYLYFRFMRYPVRPRLIPGIPRRACRDGDG